MSVATDFADSEAWTPARLDAFLSEASASHLDWRRFEIVDGALVVSPPAGRPHERIVPWLGVALASALPDGIDMIAAARIQIGRSYFVTDFTVLAAASVGSSQLGLDGRDVLIAVEIESPSSVTMDRVTKPVQYASAGIPHYWRVETDPLRLVTYALRDGAYVPTGSWGADETATITDPFPVTIDLATLLPR